MGRSLHLAVCVCVFILSTDLYLFQDTSMKPTLHIYELYVCTLHFEELMEQAEWHSLFRVRIIFSLGLAIFGRRWGLTGENQPAKVSFLVHSVF